MKFQGALSEKVKYLLKRGPSESKIMQTINKKQQTRSRCTLKTDKPEFSNILNILPRILSLSTICDRDMKFFHFF